MIKINRNRAIILLLLFTLVACAHSQPQRISPGNVLEIVVYGHEEMSRTVTVENDGTINFPLLEGVPIDGLTAAELREILVVQISKYVEHKPIITVSILDTYVINAIVLGQVNKPGAVRIPRNATIFGAIGEAGGLMPGAQLNRIRIIRENHNEKQQFEINIEDFYASADISNFPPLENGDIIIVPGYPGANAVKVIGEVRAPGNYDIFSDKENLLDAIFKAGGFTEDADMQRIKLISGVNEKSREIELNLTEKIKYNLLEEIARINPGDIIFVPQKRKFWKSTISVLRDITSIATLYIIFRYGRKL
ncbi:SLBB domain-containing protein [candidate division KSB1 bacterium]|nr:SLBB domain-containing protein [candidate division KSB1 bacterium]